MKVAISNRCLPGQGNYSKENFQSLELFARAMMARADGAWRDLSIVLLDDGQMTALNREYFSKDRPTDVISFTYAPGVGEIFVNAELARRAKSPSRELALYIAHGCDHLAGADDDTPARRARMLAREKRWLREAGSAADNLL